MRRLLPLAILLAATAPPPALAQYCVSASHGVEYSWSDLIVRVEILSVEDAGGGESRVESRVLRLWKGDCLHVEDGTLTFTTPGAADYGVGDLVQVGERWILHGAIEGAEFAPTYCSAYPEFRDGAPVDQDLLVAYLESRRREETLSVLYDSSDAVVSGRVTSVSPGPDWTLVSFLVDEAFLGPLGKIWFWMPNDGPPAPDLGGEYVLFLAADPDGYVVQPCGIFDLAYDADTLTWLHGGTTPVHPVTWGRLKTRYGETAGER